MDEYQKMGLYSQSRHDELMREAARARLVGQPRQLRVLFTLTALVLGLVVLWLR